MAKILTLFNHKGGVSKTTTTFHLGWKLTQKKKKVLLVDGDPQCNLTGMFFGDSFDEYYENDKTKKMNIKDAVSDAFQGRPRPIEAIDCPTHRKNKDLYLIPGHMDLSEYESTLGLALNSNNAIITLQNLPGSFYTLIEKCVLKYNIDYVFIDMNPGLSSLNQLFFVYSDAFIIPTNPDPFSLMALKTLKKVLPRWREWANHSIDIYSESSYPLPRNKTKFIGEIIQRFNIRNGKPANPYERKIQEIKTYIDNEFASTLKKYDMVYDITPLIAKGVLEDYCLGEISEFASLIQKANEAMIPVFMLDKDTMETTGNVYKSMEAKREHFDKIYDHIVSIILELCK